MFKGTLDYLLSLCFMILILLMLHVLKLVGSTFNSYIHSTYIYHRFTLMLSQGSFFCSISHLKGWIPPTQGWEQVFEWLIPWWKMRFSQLMNIFKVVIYSLMLPIEDAVPALGPIENKDDAKNIKSKELLTDGKILVYQPLQDISGKVHETRANGWRLKPYLTKMGETPSPTLVEANHINHLKEPLDMGEFTLSLSNIFTTLFTLEA